MNKSGFTLVELVYILTIVGIIAAVVSSKVSNIDDRPICKYTWGEGNNSCYGTEDWYERHVVIHCTNGTKVTDPINLVESKCKE